MYSLIILKPDCVKMKLHGLLISEISTQWNLLAMELRKFHESEIHELYKHHRHLSSWDRIQRFMCSGPSIPMIVQSDNGSLGEVRAYAMCVQGRFVRNVADQVANIIHATQLSEEAYRECDLIFPGVQLW